jgi:hypothetical protein
MPFPTSRRLKILHIRRSSLDKVGILRSRSNAFLDSCVDYKLDSDLDSNVVSHTHHAGYQSFRTKPEEAYFRLHALVVYQSETSCFKQLDAPCLNAPTTCRLTLLLLRSVGPELDVTRRQNAIANYVFERVGIAILQNENFHAAVDEGLRNTECDRLYYIEDPGQDA